MKRGYFDLLYLLVRRAVLEYAATGSPYARDRAREFIAQTRRALDQMDAQLAKAQKIELIRRYGEKHE